MMGARSVTEVCLLPVRLALAAITGLLTVLFLQPPASAASATSWQGPYLGLFVGYDDANEAWSTGSDELSPEGVLGGGLIGVNFGRNGFVFGVEADVMFVDFSDVEPCANPSDDCSLDGRLMGSLRARGGFALPRLLIYVTAGPAASYVRATSNAPGGGSDDQILVGWTFGGGIETPLGEHARLGLEYRHSDYGESEFAVAPGGARIDFATDEVTLRLTFGLE